MVIAALAASGKSSPDGLAYDVKSKVDELITAVNLLAGLSPAELAFIDGVTAGTAAASKAVVLGANSKIDALDITALTLNGTAVSATAAEINKLDGVTATTAEIQTACGKDVLALTTVDADVLAIPVTHRMVFKTTGADAEACTLADGVHGQRLTVCLQTDGGGDATITPATKNGFATVVLADAGDQVALEFFTGLGWTLLGATGVAAPPAITV